jgi:hypothetical protein
MEAVMNEMDARPPAAEKGRLGWMVGLVAAGAVAGGVAMAALPAGAQTPDPSPSTGSGTTAPTNPNPGDPTRPQRSDEQLLTGTNAEKAKAAALKAVPGATIERLETDSDGDFEAHIVKPDGTHAVVQMDKNFAVTAITECGPGGRGHGVRPGDTTSSSTTNTSAVYLSA